MYVPLPSPCVLQRSRQSQQNSVPQPPSLTLIDESRRIKWMERRKVRWICKEMKIRRWISIIDKGVTLDHFNTQIIWLCSMLLYVLARDMHAPSVFPYPFLTWWAWLYIYSQPNIYIISWRIRLNCRWMRREEKDEDRCRRGVMYFLD